MFPQTCHKDTFIFERQALRVFKSFRHKAIHSKIGGVNFPISQSNYKKT